MNDELKAKMLEYLQQFENQLKEAGEFAKNEVPLVVQEYLQWEFWCATMAAIPSGIVTVLAVIAFWKAVKHEKKLGELIVPIIFASVVVGGLLGVSCVYNTFRAAKVSIAPRVVILEKIGEIVR